MKNNLKKAELDAAEGAFAKPAYEDLARTDRKTQEIMAAMRAESRHFAIQSNLSPLGRVWFQRVRGVVELRSTPQAEACATFCD